MPTSLNPTLAGNFPNLPTPTKTRVFTLFEVGNAPSNDEMLLDGQTWDAPVSEKPVLGTTEDWVIVNPTMDMHPIHLHLVQFQLVQTQTLNSIPYLTDWTKLNGEPPLTHPTRNLPSLNPYLVGTPTKPYLNQECWKDTIQVPPASVVTIRVRFAPQDGSSYKFDPTVGPGYVWHCHILDHEDNEMMRPLEVVKPASTPIYVDVAVASVAAAAIIVLAWRLLVYRQAKKRFKQDSA